MAQVLAHVPKAKSLTDSNHVRACGVENPKSILAVGLPSLRPITRAATESGKSCQKKVATSIRLESILVPLSVSAVAAAEPALALDADNVVETLEKVEQFSATAAEKAVSAFELTRAVVEAVVKAATPVVESAAPILRDAATAAYQAAAPVVVDASSKAVVLLEENGINLQPLKDATELAVRASGQLAGPAVVAQEKVGDLLGVVPPALSFLQSQDVPVLAAEAGALVLLYLAAKPILGSIVYSVRGYEGKLTAAQTLYYLTQGGYTLVDVRTEAEKGASGTPSLPRSAKDRLLSVPVEKVQLRLRGQLNNPRVLEAELAAMKVASLKNLNRGSKIIILDSKGDVAPLVAKSLSGLGYRNTWAVKDGVDGPEGWANSKLSLDFYEAKSEVLTPSRILSGVLGRSPSKNATGGTIRVGPAAPRPRLFLPAGGDQE